MKRKFSKTGIALIGCALVCVILALAVGVPNGFFGDGGKAADLDDEDTPGIEEVMDGQTPLLIFDKSEGSRTLIDAFDKGQVQSVDLLFEKSIADGGVVSEDAEVIREAYRNMKNITVGEKAEGAGNDPIYHIYFTLDDDSEIGYAFSDKDIILMPDGTAKGTPYHISGYEGLWDYYQKLKEQDK